MTDNANASSSPISINPALARIIRHVESSDNPYALRFEPATYENLGVLSNAEIALLDKIAKYNACDFVTAKVIYSTSFGYYQLMGFNIYGLGCGDNIFEFCANDFLQVDIFNDFLDSRAINVPWSTLKTNITELHRFAEAYNGPGDPQAYAARMLQVAQELGL